VTYGAPSVVKISGSNGSYKIVATTAVRPPGASCDLAPGTLLATFSGAGPSYAGAHGLWSVSDCSFAGWTNMSFALRDGALSGISSAGTVTFTKRK
jgi:hypothetical protein